MNVVQNCVYKKLCFPAPLLIEYFRNLLMLRISAAELDGELINKYLSLPFTSPHTSGLEQQLVALCIGGNLIDKNRCADLAGRFDLFLQ